MIDLVHIHVISGSGGNGAHSFRREKFVPRGGPDGGDGGRGGDVIFEADENMTTLAHFRHARTYKSEPGVSGSNGHKHGRNGNDLILKAPVGTVIAVGGSDQTWDLDEPGKRIVIAKGGKGGRGNARFANSIRQAPSFAEKGLPGEAYDLTLELKLLADVGLVGLPNAGKSTLLRAVSKAMPDVGDFPFTTLEPVLGVVDMGMESFVMADLPGLIEGAHAGVGLGHQFLRHVERTKVLVHLIDASAEDPLKDYQTIRRELELYAETLAERPEIVVLNKIDLPDARENVESLKAALPDREVLAVSGATTEGTQQLLQALQRLLHQVDEERREEKASRPVVLPVIRPEGRDRMEVVLEDDVFVVHSKQAEEQAQKLGDGGYDALDELQQRLRRMGLERAMRRAGARPGDIVKVGNVELEWHG
ncbi:MAG: GTPase ObgE [Dehalococcoidia bacterium]